MSSTVITEADVKAAADRVSSRVRRVTVGLADADTIPGTGNGPGSASVLLAYEFMQHGDRTAGISAAAQRADPAAR